MHACIAELDVSALVLVPSSEVALKVRQDQRVNASRSRQTWKRIQYGQSSRKPINENAVKKPKMALKLKNNAVL